MGLNFYRDAALTLLVSQNSPKRFLSSDTGTTKTSQLWLGDPYASQASAQALIGATAISLNDTSGFLSAGGTAISGIQTFTYTGKSQSQLTGVAGLTANINVNATVRPSLIYKCSGNIEVSPTGSDLANYNLKVSVGITSNNLGFPGMPAIYGTTFLSSGVSGALEVFMSVAVPAGTDVEMVNWGLQTTNIYMRDASDSSAIDNTETAISPFGWGYVYRHDEAFPAGLRLFPANRQVNSNSPGFIVGQYRWRNSEDANAVALLPTQWDIQPSTIGFEKFQPGIGYKNDLAPVALTEIEDSIYMEVEHGDYFTGAFKYFLPATPNLEFIASDSNNLTYTLLQKPSNLSPIFVGTYGIDGFGFYNTSTQYTYVGTTVNPDNTARTDLPDLYFTLDRTTNVITLNTPMTNQNLFIGTVSGQPVDYFNTPIYPVNQILAVYIDLGYGIAPLYATTWTYDPGAGTIQIPNIPGSLADQPIYITCSPALAVLYESGMDTTQTIESVDLNPAFSGLAGGYFYLQQSRQIPNSLVLACDKPQINIPASAASIIGLVAYGPVYYTGDYALLIVTAYGATPGTVVPNAKLDVIVDTNTFTGLINYQDPTVSPISVITGGDGTANLVFIPESGAGQYIPTSIAATPITSTSLGGIATTNIANDTIVLPVEVPISQVRSTQDGWYVQTYLIYNNDPLFGMVGGTTAAGEVPWITSGTPGTSGYKTNGEADPWWIGGSETGAGNNIVLPIDALDEDGNSYTSGSFTGNVKQLVYGIAVQSGPTIGAYFISFLQRVIIKMQLENSNLFSNSILIQMAVPPLLIQNPWLILNNQFQGLLNQYRLGWVKPTTTGV